MSDIQLDMFEVQLGAAILLQFRANDRVVRVLADAGISASGYSLDHVHRKLPAAFNTFDNSNIKRLDLIVGTHYDADHLNGLVPIINDRAIEIGEAWMPPVANDSETHAENDSVQDSHLLGYQFGQENGKQVLLNYLGAKRSLCDELRDLERLADEFRFSDNRKRNDIQSTRFSDSERHSEHGNVFASEDHHLESLAQYFEQHLVDANSTLGISEYCHANEEFDGDSAMSHPWPTHRSVYSQLSFGFLNNPYGNAKNRSEHFSLRWNVAKQLADSDARSIAFIRQVTARDAINATSLYKVVEALIARKVPISWRMIKDGEPRRFIWVSSTERFEPSALKTSDGPEIVLLGPSESLIKKHRNRLPIGEYMATFALKAIPIKGVTPSNQLSYVLRFGFKDQGVLVAGDAGFVDFKIENTKKYHPALLRSLLPLHLIQVAHHGGLNAHFYRVLLAAGYPTQIVPSFLLLSHAAHDKTRPSKEFGMFIEQIRQDGDDVQLLFTSEPDSAKVNDYKEIIFPLVGTKATVGDVRVSYNHGKWKVDQHHIQV